MIKQKRHAYFNAVIIVCLSLFLAGCFGQSYEPATIEFYSPANSEVYPAGTESVTIHGKVTEGDAGISKFTQVSVSNGVEVFTTVDLDSNGEFYYEFSLTQIPDGVTRTFETSTCTFQATDANLKSNRERISFTVAEHPVLHGDMSMLDESMVGVSITEEFMDEAIPYINDWVQELMPGLIEEMTGKEVTVNMDWPLYDITVEIVDLEVGEFALDVDFKSGGWTNMASFEMEPSLDGNKAMLVSTKVDWPPLIWDLPVTMAVTSLNAENVNLNISVNDENTIIVKADLSKIDIDFDGVDIIIGRGDLLPEFIEDSIMPLIMDLVLDLLHKFDIPALPLLNESDLVFENLLDLNVDLAIGLPGSETYQTTEDAMAMKFGLMLDISNWDDSMPAYFVGTPGDEMPDIIAYSDDESDEDVVVAVSDDMVNQALYTLVHSGLLQSIIDKISIADLIGEIAPALVANSPDLEILLSIPTPPICNFATTNPNELVDFGEFGLNNMIIEIRNLQLTANSTAETYRFSMDAQNLPLRLGLYEEDGVQMVKAEADIDIDDVNFEILYATPPIASIGNSVIQLAKEIVKKILGDTVIPIAISMEVPDLGLPLPLPLLTLMSDSFLEDNYLVLKLDVDFPEYE